MMHYFIDQGIALFEPTGMVWVILMAITVAFAWRRCWRPAIAVAVPATILYVFGATDVPGWLMRGLERPYAGVDIASLPKADAIVILGAGAQPARFEVADMHLTGSADRIIMGLELARLGKAPVVVLGGSVAQFPDGDRLESETVRNWIVERKLVPGEVVSLPGCADTHDEALFVKKLASERGWQQVLLVTSASHMKRAAATFQTVGVRVVPAPCNFMTELSQAPSVEPPGLPRAGGIQKTEMWLHETIGWIEYRRRGWIKP